MDLPRSSPPCAGGKPSAPAVEDRLARLSAAAARAGANGSATSSSWASWPSMGAAAWEERVAAVLDVSRWEEVAPEVEAKEEGEKAKRGKICHPVCHRGPRRRHHYRFRLVCCRGPHRTRHGYRPRHPRAPRLRQHSPTPPPRRRQDPTRRRAPREALVCHSMIS
uniref:Electron transfer flavoprotein beta-subunit n=1 Tax=Arundo donax TaxID=35708 RepID=A0A0A8Z620_ARUDO